MTDNKPSCNNFFRLFSRRTASLFAGFSLLILASVSNAAVIVYQPGSTTWNPFVMGSATTFRNSMSAYHSYSQIADFSNPGTFGSADVLWVNNQLNSQQGALGATEITNITNHVTAGGRAVFITDNGNWSQFNASIDQVTGGMINNACDSSNGTPTSSHQLTTGITSISNSCGSIVGNVGNVDLLFSNGLAGLYSVGAGEVLVYSSVDAFTGSNATYVQFWNNTAAWLDTPVPNSVPEPFSLLLLAGGLLGVGFKRGRR